MRCPNKECREELQLKVKVEVVIDMIDNITIGRYGFGEIEDMVKQNLKGGKKFWVCPNANCSLSQEIIPYIK